MNKIRKNMKTLGGTGFRPQQGLTIMNVKKKRKRKSKHEWFPSPTGVNYYEFETIKEQLNEQGYGFRPQQGLTIMNQNLIF